MPPFVPAPLATDAPGAINWGISPVGEAPEAETPEASRWGISPPAKAPEVDPLAASVARLMAALHGLTRYSVDGPGRVSWRLLVDRTGCDEAALRSAGASGFLTRRTARDPEGRPRTSVRITPLGRSIFAPTVEIISTVAPELADLPHPDLIAAVARDGSPAPQAEALARRLGRDVDALWADLGQCEAAGAVHRWPDHPDGPSVAISPWLAARLGLALASDGSRWVRPGQLDPTDWAGLALTSLVSLDDDHDGEWSLDVPDPDALDGLGLALLDEAGELALAIRERDLADIDERSAAHEAEARALTLARQGRDRAERRALEAETRRLPAPERKRLLADLEARQGADRMREVMDRLADPRPEPSVRPLPAPRMLLGMRPTWPILKGGHQGAHPWTPADGPCPGCGGSGRLALLAVCLVCHRSGLDGLLPPVEPSMRPPVERPPVKAPTGKKRGRPPKQAAPLKGGLGAA